jgi:hypothetical protein
MRSKSRAQNAPMRFDLRRIPLSQRLQKQRRAFDVGEKQREHAVWQIGS